MIQKGTNTSLAYLDSVVDPDWLLALIRKNSSERYIFLRKKNIFFWLHSDFPFILYPWIKIHRLRFKDTLYWPDRLDRIPAEACLPSCSSRLQTASLWSGIYKKIPIKKLTIIPPPLLRLIFFPRRKSLRRVGRNGGWGAGSRPPRNLLSL